MAREKSKPVMLLLVAIVLAILLPLAFFLVNRPAIPTVTLPTPNAYDSLYQAGSMVRGLPEDYADTSDPAELKSFVQENAAALDLVGQAMEQQYVLPIDYEAGMQAAIDSVGPIRQAMRLLHANARIAELENDPAREAILYAKMFTLSSKSAHGGLGVHVLAAAAYERLALNKLKVLVGELADAQKSEVAVLLNPVDRQPRNLNQMLEREHLLVKKEHGTLSGTWMIWSTKGLAQPAIQRISQVDAEIIQHHQEVQDLLGQ